MKKMNKKILPILVIVLSVTMLNGCKKAKKQETETDKPDEAAETVTPEPEDAEILENEGDIEIVIPDDQESAGE